MSWLSKRRIIYERFQPTNPFALASLLCPAREYCKISQESRPADPKREGKSSKTL